MSKEPPSILLDYLESHPEDLTTSPGHVPEIARMDMEFFYGSSRVDVFQYKGVPYEIYYVGQEKDEYYVFSDGQVIGIEANLRNLRLTETYSFNDRNDLRGDLKVLPKSKHSSSSTRYLRHCWDVDARTTKTLDPDDWYREYFDARMGLRWVRPMVLAAGREGKAIGLVPADLRSIARGYRDSTDFPAIPENRFEALDQLRNQMVIAQLEFKSPTTVQIDYSKFPILLPQGVI